MCVYVCMYIYIYVCVCVVHFPSDETGLKRIFKNPIARYDILAAWEQLFWCVVWDAQTALHAFDNFDKLRSEEGTKLREGAL